MCYSRFVICWIWVLFFCLDLSFYDNLLPYSMWSFVLSYPESFIDHQLCTICNFFCLPHFEDAYSWLKIFFPLHLQGKNPLAVFQSISYRLNNENVERTLVHSASNSTRWSVRLQQGSISKSCPYLHGRNVTGSQKMVWNGLTTVPISPLLFHETSNYSTAFLSYYSL